MKAVKKSSAFLLFWCDMDFVGSLERCDTSVPDRLKNFLFNKKDYLKLFL